MSTLWKFLRAGKARGGHVARARNSTCRDNRKKMYCISGVDSYDIRGINRQV